jgi:hypothetical protein
VAPRKISCTFVCRIYPKENINYTGVLQIFHTKIRLDIESLMVVVSDKILPRQSGHLGQELTENHQNSVTTLAAPRRERVPHYMCVMQLRALEKYEHSPSLNWFSAQFHDYSDSYV